MTVQQLVTSIVCSLIIFMIPVFIVYTSNENTNTVEAKDNYKNTLTYEIASEKIIIENIDYFRAGPGGVISFSKDDKDYTITAPYSFVEYE